MVFSSLVFLFFFLPCTVLLYYACRSRAYRNTVLLIASLLFYSWGEPKIILLLLLTALVAYLGVLLAEKLREKGHPLEKLVYICTLILIVSSLFVFKYLNFTAKNIGLLLGRNFGLREIALPIGISFYTFQTLSYVIDHHRGVIKVQRNPFLLLLYIALFPQLIAGPIVRYKTVEEEICSRSENLDDIWSGFKRFIVGLGKKVILANNTALICDAIYQGNISAAGTAGLWLAALAYTMQIYFDFSGYSDMAIGMGQMFGFHFLENFNHPYSALSVTDFWRRWHISLSSWFRDYIYIPLGGNRVSRPRWLFNILVVWLLTGFWHGAEWNFIFWGLYYALLLIGEKIFWGRMLKKLPKVLQWLYTFLLVMIGWVIFYHTDSKELLLSLTGMFKFSAASWGQHSFDGNILLGIPFLIASLFFIFPNSKIKQTIDRVLPSAVRSCALLGLFAICIMFILSSSYNPFIYFRF